MVSTHLLTIKQIAKESPASTEGQLRWWIFHHEKYEFGHVVVKVGRRVLLDRLEFNRWIEKQRLAPLTYKDAV